MQQTQLQKTHTKLTLLFTGVVFFVVFILGISTLGVKLYNDVRIQKREFIKSSTDIIKILETKNVSPKNLFLKQAEQTRKLSERITREPKPKGRPFISFLILDKNNDIVFENILEKPHFSTLIFDKTNLTYIDDGLLVRVSDIDAGEGKKAIFFLSLRYGISDFFQDALLFLFLTGISTILFYFIGNRFVGKALEPVRENLKDMSDFIHNAGHELKTPLAIMRGNLQIQQVEKNYDPELAKQAIKQVDKMNSLIEGLIELSEVGKTTQRVQIALATEVALITERFLLLAQEKNIELKNSVKGKFLVFANREELSILISNIIQNALKYTPVGGKIEISLEKNILTIVDTGSGIKKEDQEKIWDRFFQGSLFRNTEGFGIGLSLVKKIADNHRWKLAVESEEEKGTKMKVIF